ncbi:MAG: hypothetical protein KFF72_00125 [Arthrospira sp. SH-MAG29]|nr:hypothetical protein [Arthrospira sp. SH-MAG29]MBS0014775.1 hypothetical protein [Arthrospira sp. SH-MAG29]
MSPIYPIGLISNLIFTFDDHPVSPWTVPLLLVTTNPVSRHYPEKFQLSVAPEPDSINSNRTIIS